MEITYLGHSSVRLRGRDSTVVVDPTPAMLSALNRARPDIVVRTSGSTDADTLRPREGHSQEVSGPGEFEVRGVAIHGLGDRDATIMRIEVDDVRIVTVGTLNRQLTEDEIDSLGHVDVLVIPVGGGDALDAQAATKVARAVEPAIVVPVRYGDEFGPVDPFAKEMGMAEGWVSQPKLNLTGSMPNVEETRVVILEPRSL